MLLRSIILTVATLVCAVPSQAASLYVAASGGATACSRTSPCADLSQALNNAAPGDTILCISPPNYSNVEITKSITIDCPARAPVREIPVYTPSGGPNAAKAGVSINAPGAVVRLRGLMIDGSTTLTYDRGIDIQSAAAVYIEDCVIQNVNEYGILDRRTGGQTKLFVKDTFISGAKKVAVLMAAQSVGIGALDNVRLENNVYGLAAAAGNNVVINRSVISGNTTAGVEADGGAQLEVIGSLLSHNAAHVQASGTVRLRENDLKFSNVAIQGSAARSMGANRFSANGSNGTIPALASGAQPDVFD